MAVAGAVFALTDDVVYLIVAGLTGTLSTDSNESGPITSIEQAMLSATPRSLRARIFGRYNAVAYLAGAVGALAAGGPSALRSVVPGLPPERAWLLVLTGGALVCALIASRLGPAVEILTDTLNPGEGRHASRSRVRRLGALFALDAFGGGFIVTSFIVFWFGRAFGVGTEVMGLVFFGVGLLQAGSSVVAGRLAGRIGLLNTMVFTHLPSNLILALIPFAPSLALAIALLLLRSVLSQMDVPARQAYLASVVPPEDRTAAAGYTNAARQFVRPFGPALASISVGIANSMPFLIAGGLKVIYDVTLFVMFRNVELADD
jgi:predicted MFS family arabinose efflux permease